MKEHGKPALEGDESFEVVGKEVDEELVEKGKQEQGEGEAERVERLRGEARDLESNGHSGSGWFGAALDHKIAAEIYREIGDKEAMENAYAEAGLWSFGGADYIASSKFYDMAGRSEVFKAQVEERLAGIITEIDGKGEDYSDFSFRIRDVIYLCERAGADKQQAEYIRNKTLKHFIKGQLKFSRPPGKYNHIADVCESIGYKGYYNGLQAVMKKMARRFDEIVKEKGYESDGTRLMYKSIEWKNEIRPDNKAFMGERIAEIEASKLKLAEVDELVRKEFEDVFVEIELL
jgi:hypothetical protein